MKFRTAATSGLFVGIFATSLTMGLLSAVRPAEALPKYSQTEKKPCGFCHVNPKGSGVRTPAGIWYGSHGHSLKGFKPAAPAKGGKPAPKKPAKK